MQVIVTGVEKEGCIAAQIGKAWGVLIEDEFTIGVQVCVESGITLAKGTIIYAQSGLGHSTDENKTYFGSPAEEARNKFKEMAYIKKIPELIDKLKNI